MKYARIDGGKVVEIIQTELDINQQFHPDFVKLLVECDGDVAVGYSYIDGVFYEPLLMKSTPSLDDFMTSIDNHIIQQIKTLDYDSLDEVALAAIRGEFQVEALRVNEWVHECWDVQSQIKSGVSIYDSIDDALLALPPFDI